MPLETPWDPGDALEHRQLVSAGAHVRTKRGMKDVCDALGERVGTQGIDVLVR